MTSISEIGNKIVTIGWETSPNQSWYIIHKEHDDYYEKSGGLVIEGYELVDFDGTFSLPQVVADALRFNGIKVSPDCLS